jgi:drug/metabolite transporter (DMT)-like permease
MALTAQALVGSSFAAAVALDDYPIAGGQAARYALAALVMLVIGRFRLPPLTRADLLPLLALTVTGLAVFNWLMIVGVEISDPASMGVVVGCVPVVLAILGPLQRGQRPRAGVVAAGVVVAAGAALVQWTGSAPVVLGVVLAVLALACEAAFTLFAVPLLPRLGALGITQWATLLVVPMLAAWALVVEGPSAQRLPETGELLALLWLTAGVTAVAFLCWYGAVQRIGADRAGLFSGVLPVSAAALGAIAGSVAVNPVRILGAVLVAAGVTAGMLAGRRPAAAPTLTP